MKVPAEFDSLVFRMKEIILSTLDLRDAETQRQFLEQLRRLGVPVIGCYANGEQAVSKAATT